MIRNPFIIFGLINLLLLCLYQLNWSRIYPELKMELILFILFISMFFMVFGFIFKCKRTKLKEIHLDKKSAIVTVILIGIGYVVEFFYSATIPLISVLTGNQDFNYQSFGIPTFHIFVIIRYINTP